MPSSKRRNEERSRRYHGNLCNQKQKLLKLLTNIAGDCGCFSIELFSAVNLIYTDEKKFYAVIEQTLAQLPSMELLLLENSRIVELVDLFKSVGYYEFCNDFMMLSDTSNEVITSTYNNVPDAVITQNGIETDPFAFDSPMLNGYEKDLIEHFNNLPLELRMEISENLNCEEQLLAVARGYDFPTKPCQKSSGLEGRFQPLMKRETWFDNRMNFYSSEQGLYNSRLLGLELCEHDVDSVCLGHSHYVKLDPERKKDELIADALKERLKSMGYKYWSLRPGPRRCICTSIVFRHPSLFGFKLFRCAIMTIGKNTTSRGHTTFRV